MIKSLFRKLLAMLERNDSTEEWLVIPESMKAHRFAIHKHLSREWRYAACGFETRGDKLLPESARSMRCKNCQKAQGWG